MNVRRISIVGAGTGGNKTYSFATYSGYDGNTTVSFKQPGRPNFVPKELYKNFGLDLLSISKDDKNPNNPEVNGWEKKGQYEYYLYVSKISLGGLTPGSTIDERNVRNR